VKEAYMVHGSTKNPKYPTGIPQGEETQKEAESLFKEIWLRTFQA